MNRVFLSTAIKYELITCTCIVQCLFLSMTMKLTDSWSMMKYCSILIKKKKKKNTFSQKLNWPIVNELNKEEVTKYGRVYSAILCGCFSSLHLSAIINNLFV